MKNKKSAWLLVALAMSFGQVATSQRLQDSSVHNYAFSAKEAVDYAIQNSAQVKNALLDIESQEQMNKQITASALPQISGTAGLTFNPQVAVQTVPDFISMSTYGVLIKNNVKDGEGNPIKMPTDIGFLNIGFGAKWAGSAGVSLNQLLFDGQVFVGLQARKASIRNKQMAAAVTTEQIKANVYKIYYQLVVGQRQITTLDANITNLEKLLHDTKEIYKNGFAEKLDVDKVQVQLINLQTQKLKAQNQIDAGIEGLKFLMGMPQKDQLTLTDTLSDDELKSNILDAEYNYEDRKEYQQLLSLIDLGKFNVKRYQLSKLPTVSLAANYGESGQWQSLDVFKGPYFSSSFIALQIRVPIFDGGAKNAQAEQARIDLRKMDNSKEQLKMSIDNEVKQSRLEMTTALSTMDAQKRNIDLATQVYNTTKLKYEQGLGSNLEISTAQTDLITAQNNYYSALYDAIISKINYLQAAGKL